MKDKLHSVGWVRARQMVLLASGLALHRTAESLGGVGGAFIDLAAAAVFALVVWWSDGADVRRSP